MARKTAAPTKDVPHAAPPGLIGVERLIFLTDGVFAIALTLLVLDLRPPEVAAAELSAGLQGMLPRLAIYLIAFFTIANQWTIHFQSFRYVRYTNTTLVWLCLANLLFVTLLPASTSVVGRFPYEPLAAACFLANSFFMSTSVAAIWAYVYRHRESFAPGAHPKILRGITLVWVTASLGIGVALGISFINTISAFVIVIVWPWLVTFVWMLLRKSPNFVSQVTRPAG